MLKIPRVLGVGTDITSVTRIKTIIKRGASYEGRFIKKVLHECEQVEYTKLKSLNAVRKIRLYEGELVALVLFEMYVSKAVLAERENCARLADDFPEVAEAIRGQRP